MRLVKYQIISVVFILLIVLIIGARAGEQVITRTVAGIELGMSLQEVGKVFHMEEKEDAVVAIMRKFGFGDPEKQSKINKKLGKRVFAAKGTFPNEVNSINVLFRNDVLYQIALNYGKEYVQKVDWDLFTLPAINKYGHPIVSNNIPVLASFTYQWADGQTKLEIQKSGTLSDDKNKFTTPNYNVFYTDVVTYIAMEKDEKNMQEESTAIPNF